MVAQCGSFVQSAQVVRVSPHVCESPRGCVGIRKRWNARGIQDGFTGGNAVPSHPAGEHGLAIFFGVRFQAFCNLQRIGHGLRDKDDQEPIAVRVFRSNVEGASIVLGISIGENINGIVMTPVGREELVQAPQTLWRKLGQFSTIGHQRVRGQNRRAARIGQDRKPRALGAGLSAEHFGHIEKIRDIVHPQNSRPAEGRVQHFVAARECAGVRGGSPRGLLRSTGLDHDDRLGECDFTRCGQERPRISHGFHVEQDALGVRVVAKVVDQIAPINIQHRTGRDDRAEANLFALAPVEDRDQKRSTLTQERDVARPGCVFEFGPIKRIEPRCNCS